MVVFFFLFSMCYYVGNWGYSVWLFKGESYCKLDRLIKVVFWIHDQLCTMYDEVIIVAVVGKVVVFRFMYLHGRVLFLLLSCVVECVEDY